MPGTMFIQPASLAALPTSGAAWTALTADSTADPGSGNLGLIDQLHPLAVFAIALRWAKDGGGLGKQRVIDEIAAVVGTESSASQPLNPYRTIGAYILAADLVDMPGSTPCANGQTFNEWIASLYYKQMPSGSNANWNTLHKCVTVSGNNWGFCARTSALAVSLWMIKNGLTPTGTIPSGGPTTATGIRDLVIRNYKRSVGDTSVPNTFVNASAVSSKMGPGTTYPSTQGTINPPSTNGLLDGFNCEDGSRDAAMPPTSSGISYQYESLDSAAVFIAMMINAGYSDVSTYGTNGIRRNVQWMIRNDRVTAGSFNYDHQFWMQPWFWNHLYGLGMPIPGSAASDRYDRRMLTTHTDWLTSSGSTWLKVAGGDAPAPVQTAPILSYTLTRTDQTVTMNASATTAGSSAVARHEITWGDGSAVQTLTEPTRTTTHVYNPTQATTYTVTVRAFGTDGAVATSSKTILVPNAAGTPVAVLSITPIRGTAPLTITYNFAGSTGTSPTYSIDFGDGTVVNPAAASGTYTYTDVTGNGASYSVTGRVTAGGLTSVPTVKTVTVDSAASSGITGSLFIAIGGKLYPINPNEVLHLATGAPVPAGTLPGTLIFRS